MSRYEFIKDNDKNGDGVAVSNSPKRKFDLIPSLVCIMIALFVWLWMVNLNETDVTETMVLKIDVVGIEDLNDEVIVYGMDKTEIKVTVQGSNRDVRKYADGDFTATVDVSGLRGTKESKELSLPISINTPSNTSLQIIDSDPLTVNLIADEKVEATVPFDVIVENGIENYHYDIEKNVDEVTISGPKAIINTIETARFTINASLFNSLDERIFDGETSEFQLTFWDINTHMVNVDNSTISYSTKDIDITVRVSVTKEIPIIVTVNGDTPTNLYDITPVKYVKVTGPVTVMYDVTKYVIESESDSLSFTHQISAKNLNENVTVDTEGTVITVTFSDNSGS